MIDALTQPFIEFSFMRRALVGCLALSLGAPPIGVFLMLRRMSLMGDAMSHAILPGAAIGYLLAGLSLFAMSLGGFAAGLAVALACGLGRPLDRASRGCEPRRLLSRIARARRDDRLDQGQQCRSAARAVRHRARARRCGADPGRLDRHAVTLAVLAVIYRPLVLECFDPQFLRSAAP